MNIAETIPSGRGIAKHALHQFTYTNAVDTADQARLPNLPPQRQRSLRDTWRLAGMGGLCIGALATAALMTLRRKKKGQKGYEKA